MEHTQEHATNHQAGHSGASAASDATQSAGARSAGHTDEHSEGHPEQHPAEAAADPAGDGSTYTLEVSFHCLCLYVPDEEEKRVHVLMPDTRGHHPHVVKLVYDNEVLDPDKVFDMTGWSAVLPGTGGGAKTTLPGEIPDVSTAAGTKMDPVRVGDHPGEQVVSRITLDEGGVTQLLSDVFWELGGIAANIPQSVVWTAPGLPGRVLTWTRARLNDDGEPERETREIPADEDGFVRISVYHILGSDWPPIRPPRRTPADSAAHFMAFYTVLNIDTPAASLRPQFDKRVKKSYTQGCGGGKAAMMRRGNSQRTPVNP